MLQNPEIIRFKNSESIYADGKDRRGKMSMAIVLNVKDNVATALTEIESGDVVKVRNGEERAIQILQDIPFGHKFALEGIGKGEKVLKYGEVIAIATLDIRAGEHVHVHNIESLRGRGDLAAKGE